MIERVPALAPSLLAWGAGRSLTCDVSLAGDLAIFSPCLAYRLALTRQIGPGHRVLVGCGLNPSTADAFRDDNTIRKMRSFGRSWNCGLYVMLNAYAFKATDPNDMKRAAARGIDIVGQHNDELLAFVLEWLQPSDIALAAWGTPVSPARWGTSAGPARIDVLRQLAAAAGVQWQCLGRNKGGSPKHPLYLPYTTPLEAWA